MIRLNVWDKESQMTRAQLFKTNDIVSYRIVKTLIIKYGIYTKIFVEKKNCK